MVSARFFCSPLELWDIVRCVHPEGRKDGAGYALYLVSFVERVG